MKKFFAVVLALLVFVGCGNSELASLQKGIYSVQAENKILKEKIDYYLTGANNLIIELKNAYERKSEKDILYFADKLHTDFNGSKEDAEAQKYVAEINKAKEEEQARKKAEEEAKKKAEAEAKKRAEEEAKRAKKERLRNIIRVTSVKPYNMDYLGGTDLIVNFVNKSDKVIKYITFYCQPFNAVGDAVSCEIQYKSAASLEHLSEGAFEATGPYAKGEGISGTSRGWSKAWYNSSIKSVKLNKINIEYMDGSTEVISGEDVSYVMY